MKKLLCLLLVLALFLPVAFAAAESESQESDNNLVLPGDFPFVCFGADPETAIKYFNAGWTSFSKYASEPVEGQIAVSTGAPITALTFPAEAAAEDELRRPTTVKLYFLRGKLFAAIQETEIPEGADFSNAKSFIKNGLKAGKEEKLRMAEIGINAELLGEEAHLAEEQDVWRYTFSDGEYTSDAIIAMCAVDGKMYVAEFLAEKSETQPQKKEITLSLTDLNGFAELSNEQKSVVRTYAQYLLQQQKKMLEEYVEFVKNNP